MEFFVEKTEKKIHKKEVDYSSGLKRGDNVVIYRPLDYKGPSQTIFHYKGYHAEVAEDESYYTDDVAIKVLGKNHIKTIKVNKKFLKKIDL